MLANSLPPVIASAASAAIVSVLGPTAVSGPGPGPPGSGAGAGSASVAMASHASHSNSNSNSRSLHPAPTHPAKIDIVPKALSHEDSSSGSGCPTILSEANGEGG